MSKHEIRAFCLHYFSLDLLRCLNGEHRADFFFLFLSFFSTVKFV
jgi:hypothetical protein